MLENTTVVVVNGKKLRKGNLNLNVQVVSYRLTREYTLTLSARCHHQASAMMSSTTIARRVSTATAFKNSLAPSRLAVRSTRRRWESSSKAPETSSDRLHSTDIAFKPTEDGWGYSPRYAQNWDKIFSKKSEEVAKVNDAPAPTKKACDPRDIITLRRILKDHAEDAHLQATLAELGWTKTTS